MKLAKKIIGRTLALLVVLIVFWVTSNLSDIKAFPSIISSYYAKEFCSCYFVVGREEKACHTYVKQYIPIQDFHIDTESKKVTVTGLYRTNSAKYVSERYGCVLE